MLVYLLCILRYGYALSGFQGVESSLGVVVHCPRRQPRERLRNYNGGLGPFWTENQTNLPGVTVCS